MAILTGEGNGGFSISKVTNEAANIDNFYVADVNGDGFDDIITVHFGCDYSI